MPTYAAYCEKCKRSAEYVARMSEREALLPECPDCKVKMVKGVIGNYGGTVYKGTGWVEGSKPGTGKKY